ncbi:MAG TPA: amidohydrolase family protein [Gemmatimonadaceae bacterium]|nr:amidohydrolase family protein [Gemmatimonadaceae bacterium]
MPNLSRLAPLAAWALVVVARPARPQGGAPQPADLLLVNTRIYTVDQSHPFVAAMAVRDGRVQFVGSTQEAMLLRGQSTRMLDLKGSTVIPGMIDAHAHLFGLGTFLHNIDLRDTRSYDEVVARVADRVKQAPAGRWIVGRAWDQNKWGNTRFPTHEALSRVSPNNPVLLTRVDGHAILVNAAAMRAAGVSAASKDPAGGRIERGAGGEPTGVFVDNAMGLVEKAVPPLSHDEMQSAALDAIAESNRWGLTALDDPGEPRDVLDVFEELAKTGKFNLRVYAMIADDSAAIEHYFQLGPQSGLYDNRLWIRSIKLYADGALGSRGAALLDPYNDDPKNVGLLKSTPEHLRDVSIRALRHGFQVATHAIGDRGNRVALDAYEAALETVPTVDHRFRIEHVQILDHADVPRFAKLGVIPSMQAVHQTSDMYWAPNRLGYARTLGAYAWRSLLNTGVVIPNGSDFPVERVNPLFSFHAAVARQDDDNWPPNGWFPEQRMTRQEALQSITIWPAYAAFQEQLIGSLSPGKLADFVILDRDIMTVPESDILGTHVVATYIGGRAVFERGR